MNTVCISGWYDNRLGKLSARGGGEDLTETDGRGSADSLNCGRWWNKCKQARFKYRNSTNDLTNSQGTAHAISFQAMESHCDVKRNYNRKTRTSARV